MGANVPVNDLTGVDYYLKRRKEDLPVGTVCEPCKTHSVRWAENRLLKLETHASWMERRANTASSSAHWRGRAAWTLRASEHSAPICGLFLRFRREGSLHLCVCG